MFRCHACSSVFASAYFSGWIVKAVGTVTVGENGELVSSSPLTAISTIKSGHELTSCYKPVITCPSCGKDAKVTDFSIVRRCRVSGSEADKSVTTRLGNFWINSVFEPELLAIIAFGEAWELQL